MTATLERAQPRSGKTFVHAQGPKPTTRRCNLLLVCKRRRHEDADFRVIADIIRRRAPEICPMIISDRRRNAFWPSFWMRPTLAVSNEGLRSFRPLRGPLFHGCQMPKSQEYAILDAHGVPVPPWKLLEEGERPDPAVFGKYAVVKPDLGACGAAVRIGRTSRIRGEALHTDYEGSTQTLVQKFIYTGRWAVSYRVSTYFGRVLSAWRNTADQNRRALEHPEAFAGGADGGGISIVSSGRGCTYELYRDEEVFELARQAHAAFPHLPLLGTDIIREESTGKLYVTEVNSCGRTWHFSSDRGLKFQREFSFDMKSQFGALEIAADALIDQARNFAA